MDLNGYRIKYGDRLLPLVASSVVLEGLKVIAEREPLNPAEVQLREVAQQLRDDDWNHIRSFIKRCL